MIDLRDEASVRILVNRLQSSPTNLSRAVRAFLRKEYDQEVRGRQETQVGKVSIGQRRLQSGAKAGLTDHVYRCVFFISAG